MAGKPGRPTGSKDVVKTKMQAKMRAFLDAYSILGNITKACKAAGVCHKTYRDYKNREDNLLEWRGLEVSFKDALPDALAEAVDGMEAEARKRATVGTQELVLHQGKPVMIAELDAKGEPTGKMVPHMKSKYSDLLLIFLLKGALPNKYADHRTVDSTINVTHTHKGIRELPPKQQQERMDRLVQNRNRLLGITGKN